MSTPGVKHDDGKTRAGLMMTDFAHALYSVARVTTFGAEKYTDSGWKSVPEARSRYTDALCRHLLAWLAGEAEDHESLLPTLAHVAWNCLALLQMESENV